MSQNQEIEIRPDMTIREVLELKPAAARVLLSMGMHCLGCAIANSETLEEAAIAHGVDLNKLIEDIKNC